MVFDVTRPETFETVGYWAEQIEANCETKPSVILIGNKYDLRNERAIMPDAKIKSYAKNKNWYFFYASALENHNIK